MAIITGSDSGMGKATAVELARQGFAVGITWHEDEDGARDTASEVEHRPGGPREVASLIAWLCSDSAQYVTGSSFVIDGGMLLTAAIQE